MKKTQIYKRISACALAIVMASTAPAGVLAHAPRDVAFQVTEGGFVQENYTPASWQTYEGALNHAKGLLEAECDQETVDSAASSLLSAIEGLVPAAANGAFARVGVGDVPAGFEDYTAVSTKEELAGLANQAGKYVLTSDIDLSGEAWTSIANFSGTLDGNFHKITGLTGGDNCNGLFGESNGQFKNIIIDGAVLRAKVDRTGALAGSLTGGASVEGCAVVNSEIYGQHQIGGLAAQRIMCPTLKTALWQTPRLAKTAAAFMWAAWWASFGSP